MSNDKIASKVGKILAEKILKAPSEKLGLRIISQFQACMLVVLYSILVEYETVNYYTKEHISQVSTCRWTVFLRAIWRGC